MESEGRDTKRFLSVMASDGVVAGVLTKVSVLNDSLHRAWKEGIPLNIGHDLHRPIGWTMPLAICSQPGRNELIARSDIFGPKMPPKFERTLGIQLLSRFTRGAEQFSEKLTRAYGGFAIGESLYVSVECAAVLNSGIASRYFSNVFQKKDKSGLIRLADLPPYRYLGAGVFAVGDVALFAHPYFRRSLSRFNSTNFEFLDRLLNIASQEKYEVRIALDEDLLGLPETFVSREERHYWWGPEFDNELTAITPGLAYRHATDDDRYYYGVDGVEFWWQSRDGKHILEAEEKRSNRTFADPISSHERGSEEEYGCRYVHSIVDEKTRAIEHFDGAVRIYSEDEMIVRFDQKLPEVERDKQYKKLWLVNGPIGISEWKTLLTHYYRDNYLVGQYLGGVDKARGARRKRPTLAPANKAKKLVPYAVPEQAGVRLSVSYHNQYKMDDERLMSVLDRLTVGETSFAPVDLRTIELKKILARIGLSLSFESKPDFLWFQDRFVMIPLIRHRTTDALRQTLAATFRLFEASTKLRWNYQYIFSVSFPLDEETDVWFSFLGSDYELSKWFEMEPELPNTSEEISSYLERLANYNSSKRPYLTSFLDVIEQDGLLNIRRHPVERGKKLRFKRNEDGTLSCSLEKRAGNESKSNGEDLRVGVACITNISPCSKCGVDYLTCPCSLIMDGVAPTGEISRVLFPFWTL